MAEEPGTQLADTRPWLDSPLRVALPVHVPDRIPRQSRDSTIHAHVFRPLTLQQTARRKQLLAETSRAALPNPDDGEIDVAAAARAWQAVHANEDKWTGDGSGMLSSNGELDAASKNAMKDFAVLSISSHRAGKSDVEAMAYASLGVLSDNRIELQVANDHYTKYIGICESLGDNLGIAAGQNCLGVNFMLLANPELEPSSAMMRTFVHLDSQTVQYQQLQQEIADQAHRHDPYRTSTTASTAATARMAELKVAMDRANDLRQLIQQAILAHQKHLEVAPDLGGQFVAFSNMGLCYAWLGDITQGARYYQDALRIAIKMQTLYGQSIAVGNLGLLAMQKEDYSTARTCFDQHLQLVQALLDPEAEVAAWKMLGELCSRQGYYGDAFENLEQARRVAEREQLMNELRVLHCLIGVAKGNLEFESYIANISASRNIEEDRIEDNDNGGQRSYASMFE